MAGGVLSSKEEGGHLRQQPVIAQQLPRARIPATPILSGLHQVISVGVSAGGDTWDSTDQASASAVLSTDTALIINMSRRP